MTKINTKDLTVDAVFKADLTLDGKIVALAKDVKVSGAMINLLNEWKIAELMCDEEVALPKQAADEGVAKKVELSAKEIRDQKAAIAKNTTSVDIGDFL